MHDEAQMSRADHDSHRELEGNPVNTSVLGLLDGSTDLLQLLMAGAASLVAVGFGLWWTTRASRRRRVQRKRVGIANRQLAAESPSNTGDLY